MTCLLIKNVKNLFRGFAVAVSQISFPTIKVRRCLLLAAPNTNHPEPKLNAPRQRGLTLTAPDGDNRRYLFKGLIGVGTAPNMFRLIFGAILDHPNSRSERAGEY